MDGAVHMFDESLFGCTLPGVKFFFVLHGIAVLSGLVVAVLLQDFVQDSARPCS